MQNPQAAYAESVRPLGWQDLDCAARKLDSRRSERRPMLRATHGDLCCAQDYVAYRAEREGASGCLRADSGLWGRRCFRSLSRQRNIFSAGLRSRPSRCGPTMSRSTGLTCTLRPARNSSGACSIVLGRRIAKRGRCRTSHAVRVDREPSTGPKLCCAGKPRSPATAPTFGRGQHSSARNIGRHRDRRAPPELPTPFIAKHSCDAGDQRDRGVAEAIAGWREGPRWKRSRALAAACTPTQQRSLAGGELLERA
jgi:hypothetical protein